MLGHEDKHKGYANYVMAGVDAETAQLYSKGNMASIIGDKGFREWVYEELLPQLAAEEKSRVIQPDLTMGQVISVVANYFSVTEVDITKRVNGPQKENEARKLAMYFCQELVASKLTDIAARFN
jgi:putative transposase